MNAFFWKRIMVIRKSTKKLLIFAIFPIIFQLLFLKFNIEIKHSVAFSSICTTLLSSMFFWDVDDVLNYETMATQMYSRAKLVFFYFILSGILVYIFALFVSSCLAFLIYGCELNLHSCFSLYLVGLFFSTVNLAVNNGQIYNYRKWVQYLSVPFGLIPFALPVILINFYSQSVHILEQFLWTFTILGVIVLVLFIAIHNQERCITNVMKLAAGYGDMND